MDATAQEVLARIPSLLTIVRGLRNGAYYGTKIRAPHGTLREKLQTIVELTYEHTYNLAKFVGAYKAILAVLRGLNVLLKIPTENSEIGKPAMHWHSLIAGGVGGYFVWSKYSSVNYQIVLYLFSRVAIATVKLWAKKGIRPFADYKFSEVYPAIAIVTWALVMWLFEHHPDTLHSSLKYSMDFLYRESNSWQGGLTDFLPSPATAITAALHYYFGP